MLSVPEPLANDPEDVVSALEAAEIFGKQGDVKEAVRWVRRAAEIAGDTGNDERALTLARAVADLNISASQPPAPPAQAQQPQAEQPLPPPLPTSSDDPDGEAETRVVDSAKMLEDYERQQKSNGHNGAATEALATPSADLVPTAPNVPPIVASTVDTEPFGAQPDADLPPPPPPPELRADAADTAPEGAAEPATDSEPPVSRRGISSMAELLARKEAEASSAMAAAEAAGTGWEEPPPPPPPPTPSAPPPVAATSTPPLERRTARPNADRIPTPILPAQPHTDRPPLNAPIYQAVRASVVATAEPGVFVLRVLTADQSPALTAHEVLVVATNPLSSPFK